MNKTICVNVVWEKSQRNVTPIEYLSLKTHDCAPIELAFAGRIEGSPAGVIFDNKSSEISGEDLEDIKKKIEIAIFGQPATFSKTPDLTMQPLWQILLMGAGLFLISIVKL